MSWPPARRACADCGEVYDREDYSKNQWNKGIGSSRCSWCVQGLQPPTGGPSSARENESCSATYSRRPFAQGAFRLVAKGEYTEGRRKGQPCVVKWFKKGCVYEEAYFSEDIKAVEKAIHIVEQWNKQKVIDKHIQVNRPGIWEAVSGFQEGQKHLVEPFIENWEKFNSNSAWAADGTQWGKVMQALSHYSYHVSGGQFVLCDLQGGINSHGAILTDPVILSRRRDYGVTDLGADGIVNFFGHHTCNEFCRSAWSMPRDARKMFRPQKSTTMEHVQTHNSRPAMSVMAQICDESDSDDYYSDY